MGLRKKLLLSNGLKADNAYFRISNVSGNKDLLSLSVCSYVDQNGFIEGKQHLTQTFYDFIPSVEDSAPNFIKQGYEYLKSLDEYKAAIDVLDE